MVKATFVSDQSNEPIDGLPARVRIVFENGPKLFKADLSQEEALELVKLIGARVPKRRVRTGTGRRSRAARIAAEQAEQAEQLAA